MLKNVVVFIIMSSILLTGCSTPKVNPPKLPELKFDKTPEYNVREQIEKLQKPTDFQRTLIVRKGNSFTITQDANTANAVLLDFENYKKIAMLIELTKTYKNIVYDQEVLINIGIKKENAYKEFLELERLKAIAYRDLWIDSETRYNEEKYDHKFDNFINKISTGLLLLTNIATFAIFGFGNFPH